MTSNSRRVALGLFREPVLTATRMGMQKTELVYVLVANRKIGYLNGRSRIAYIGMTKAGMGRIANSVAYRADSILAVKGVTSFSAHVVHYKPPVKPNSDLWKKRPTLLLERALLIAFQQKFGSAPRCNGTGHNMKANFLEFDRFSRARIETLLEELS